MDVGSTYYNYVLESENEHSEPDGADTRVFVQAYQQSRVSDRYEWSVESLDIVLGLVGGFSGIVWSALGYLLMGYQNFKYENSLIGSIFPTSPGGSDYGEANIVPSDETEAKE